MGDPGGYSIMKFLNILYFILFCKWQLSYWKHVAQGGHIFFFVRAITFLTSFQMEMAG